MRKGGGGRGERERGETRVCKEAPGWWLKGGGKGEEGGAGGGPHAHGVLSPEEDDRMVARWLLLQVEMAERRDGPDGSLLIHTNFWEFHNFKEKERMSEGKEIREERNKIGQGFLQSNLQNFNFDSN